jgi:asparagine synthase (glutamine-hydrolysing)
MCGIAGYFGARHLPHDDIQSCLARMRRRGPDHCGFEHSTTPGGNNVYLLHSRLSIVDRDLRSNQPFRDGPCSITFNGEIYNHRELRDELERAGEVFATNSDTEVLLRLFRLQGVKCLSRCEGMWAFAVYDRQRGQLHLSRDRFAEKPLYFLKEKDGFYFGSEVKFLEALIGRRLTVNRRHLLRYLVNGYKSLYKQDETFFEDVREVPFASHLLFDDELRITFDRYWNPRHTPQDMTLNEAVDAFRDALLKSIQLRLRADVPLAFCLSGGIDSSAIVSIASKCFNYDAATFSIIDSDERYNERDNIEATLRDIDCPNVLINTSRDNFFPSLKDLIHQHDAPIATISYYIHSFLSEAVSTAGYRVVCSGTGADESIYVSVRNDGSRKTARKLLGQTISDKLKVFPDGGFFARSDGSHNVNPLQDEMRIGINIAGDMMDRRFGSAARTESFFDTFSDLLAGLATEFETLRFVFFAHIFRDFSPISNILERLPDCVRRTRIEVPVHSVGLGRGLEILDSYKTCNLVLGNRFHANVCPIGLGVPTVGLVNYPQVGYLYEELSLEHRKVVISDSQFGQPLMNLVRGSLSNEGKVRAEYSRCLQDLERQGYESYADLGQWIRSHI